MNNLVKLDDGYLTLKSEYYTVNYNETFLDVWMFTNSTDILLHHVMERKGSLFLILSAKMAMVACRNKLGIVTPL